MLTLTIMAIVMNLVFVAYLQADRANDRANEGVTRLLAARQAIDRFQGAVRTARAVAPAEGAYTTGADTLILCAADGSLTAFARREGHFVEFDPKRGETGAIRYRLHLADLRFEYLGRAPADARGVACTFTIDAVWPDTSDRTVLRTAAAIRTEPEAQP